MDRLEAMAVFVAVAEEEGFAAGARRLRMSPPAVTRAVAALEKQLGVRLLERTTRIVRATEAGGRYLGDARRILAELQAADESAAGANAEPRGLLSVTAPAVFGRIYVLPVVVEYLERYPDAKVSLLLVDRVVNLLEEGMDVAVRIGALPDSSMRAHVAGSVRLMTCASQAYLRLHGVPKKPEDLANHVTIASRTGGAGGLGSMEWRFEGPRGTRLLRLKPRLTVTTNDAAIEAALLDHGLARVLSYQVASHLTHGRLKVVLAKFETPPRPIHILHHEPRHASAKVRAFVDLMLARLRADLALNPQRSR